MKSITQRRIFSLLLSLAMLIGLLPALGSIASAAGSGTTEGDPRIVTTYAELSSALSSGVTYVKLGANINTKDFNDGAGYNKSIQQTGTVQLDLDGYSVTFFSRTSPLPAAIRVTGDLSVKDSRGGGKLYIDANPNTASSKQVLILALGHKKARALQQCVEGPYSHVCTISAMQVLPHGIVVCDEPATVELKVGTYRYFKDIEKENLI